MTETSSKLNSDSEDITMKFETDENQHVRTNNDKVLSY